MTTRMMAVTTPGFNKFTLSRPKTERFQRKTPMFESEVFKDENTYQHSHHCKKHPKESLISKFERSRKRLQYGNVVANQKRCAEIG